MIDLDPDLAGDRIALADDDGHLAKIVVPPDEGGAPEIGSKLGHDCAAEPAEIS